MSERRRVISMIGLALLVAALAALRMLIDRDPAGGLGLAWPESTYAVFRVNSIVVAAIIGVALAVSGVLLQALLRNPLASPFILGLSSGAGLGVMIAMYLAYTFASMEFLIGRTNALPALLGALIVLGIVYGLGHRRGLLDPLSLVLIGVVISAICGALILFFQRLVPAGLRGDFMVWMMGHVPQGIDRGTMILFGAMAGLGVFLAMSMGRAMDAATLGDDEARSVGLSVGPLRLGLFVLAGALTAASVAVAGPIAFVGLISPHAARLLIGPRHTLLVPASALLGAALLIGADCASQVFDVGTGPMPVGVFTALIGGPAFIWLLKTGRGQA